MTQQYDVHSFAGMDGDGSDSAPFAFDDLVPEVSPEGITFTEPEEPENDETYDEPDRDFVKRPRRKAHANEYEKRLKGLINVGMRSFAEHKATVPDAATLVMYGPRLAETWADAAAADPRIGAAIDFFTAPTENPTTTAILATIPIVAQFLRNHEPQLEPTQRGIRIPFRKNEDGTPKRWRIKFGLKLSRLRPITNEPNALAEHVFTNPELVESFRKQGIRVAGYIG